MATLLWSWALCTIDREIFVVKKFSLVAPPTKRKYFLMYMVFLCMCTAAFQRLIICSSELDDTNKMVVCHEASRVNLTTPLGHDLIYRRSRTDTESDFVGPFRVR